MTINKLRKYIRWSGAILLVVVLFCLVIREINFTGRWLIEKLPGQDSALITNLFPADRVVEQSNQTWSIIREPVYFTVRFPNRYEKVTAKFVYQNNSCQTVKVGLQQATSGDWDYESKLLDNLDFNNLPWARMSDNNSILWQKNPVYTDLQTWLNDLSELENVAGYNVASVLLLTLPDYLDYRRPVIRQVNIIGSFSYFTYSRDSLDFVFDFLGSVEEVAVRVRDQAGNLIFSTTTSDQEFSLELDNLNPGVYRVDILADGLATQTITSPQRYLSFVGNLVLAEANVQLVTEGSYLILSTDDFSGRQFVRVGEQSVQIADINKPYIVNHLVGVTKIDISTGPIKLVSNGFLAMSEADYFDPLNNQVEIIDNDSDWDYLIADYKLPLQTGDWQTNEVSFDLDQAMIANGKLRFMIACPEASQAEPLVLQSIQLAFNKKTDQGNIWTEFIDYLKYWYKSR